MTPQRWRGIEDLFHAARDLDPAARAALLQQADPELRNEVQSLLARDISAEGPLDRPAWGGAGTLPENSAEGALKPGMQLGPYLIAASLGAGGMGEVYRARDTKLDREVAIKVLPVALAQDRERLARFEREAKVLASLNHPNIAQIFSFEDSGGVRALAMELVPGATISGPLRIEIVIDYARQIAGALEAAHEKGIVHRDLKPGNIMVRPDGTLKVLDFGLARLSAVEREDGDEAATLTSPTRANAILGTAAYMSPEQARGYMVDKRADIWAFGVVLYEMATGKRLFAARNSTDILASVLKEEPDLSAVPLTLRRLLRRCLEKDAKNRLRDIGDWTGYLDDPPLPTPAALPQPTPARAKSKLAWAIAAVAIIATAGLTTLLFREQPSWFGTMLGGPEIAYGPRISPDGHTLAFLTIVGLGSQVGVMKPESGNRATLTHSEPQGSIQLLSWSPDGTRIYYDRWADVAQGIYAVPVLGGEEQLILEKAGYPEALSDGSLLVARLNPERQYQVFRYWPETGRVQGFPIAVNALGVTPPFRVFPDAMHAVVAGVRIGSGPPDTRIWLLDLTSGSIREIASGIPLRADRVAVGVMRDNQTVLVQTAVGDTFKIVAVPIGGLARPRTLFTTSGAQTIDVGADGAIYVDQVGWQPQLMRFPIAGGRPEKLASAEQIGDDGFAVPDGRAVFPESIGGRSRIMLAATGKDATPLVNTSDQTAFPACLAGPTEVAFLIGSVPHQMIGLATISNGRVTRRIPFGKGPVGSLAGSPDGRTLYVSSGGSVWTLPVAGGDPRKIHNGDSVAVDPDGQHLIVELHETSGTRLVRVSLNGGEDHEITVNGPNGLGPRIDASALRRDGLLVVPMAAPDSWFGLPGVLNTADGKLTRIPVDHVGDFHTLGWTPDGQVMALIVDYRYAMWKFQPERK